jgi:protein-L-isoaspartate O-methyltransferase
MKKTGLILLILIPFSLWAQTDRLRENLMSQVIEMTGLDSENFLIQGFSSTDRGNFLPSRYSNLAYDPVDIPMRKGVAALSPSTLISLLIKAGLTEDHRILIVGEEASYCATALSRSGMDVYLIDSGAEASSAYSLKKDNKNLNGWISMAPFEFILDLTPREEIPLQLMKQLSLRGILVSPLVSEDLHQCWFKVVNNSAGPSLSLLGPASVFPLF